MFSSNRWFAAMTALLVAVAAPLAAPLAAQESLQHIRDLYASAAYEDTISAVTSLGAADPRAEVVQYRVFSLVALGRITEAEKAVEAVLTTHPRYRPHAAEASPRIQELFATVRARVGPTAMKGLYQAGKAALDRKDREAAIRLFEEMLRTADDPDIKDQASVGELRLLGAGFLDLSRALAVAAASPAASASTPPAGATAGGPTPGDATPGGATSGTASEIPAVISGPVAIHEKLPRWVPASPSNRVEFAGTLRVMISATGTVDLAEITDSVHPAYDRLLLEAARGWRYLPAKRNGVALPSEKTVSVRLKPAS